MAFNVRKPRPMQKTGTKLTASGVRLQLPSPRGTVRNVPASPNQIRSRRQG